MSQAAARAKVTDAVQRLVMAWVLTLPAAILLSGALYWSLRHIF
jgi:PiT family inorganic phosphate transporter